MKRAGRAVGWLVLLALYLVVDYRPQHDVFHSMGDVQLYERYALALAQHPPRLPQEYPPLAAVIFALPRLIAPRAYIWAFAILSALAAGLIVVLVDWMNAQGGWLLLYMCLSGFATLFFRFDTFVVLTTLGAFLAAQARRWSLAQTLLALGVALKLYPVLLMPLLALWAWQVEGGLRRPVIRSSLIGAGLVLVSFGLAWRLALGQLQHMVQYHAARPLQIESLGTSLAWLMGPVGSIFSYGSANSVSRYGPLLIKVLTVTNVVGVLVIYGLFARRRLGPAAAFALVLLWSIATSKVFSTQYILWALPFVVVAGERRWLWLLISVATLLIYPVLYLRFQFVLNHPAIPVWFAVPVAVRNGLWLLACGLGAWTWYQPATPAAPGEPVVGRLPEAV